MSEATASSHGQAVADGRQPPVRAWDLPTRLYHWTQLVLIVGAFYTQWYMDPAVDPTMWFHRWIGYSILTLIVFRIIWGFAGSSTARFASFVRSPWAVARYAGALARNRAPAYLGHNPLGTLMILALMLIVLAQASSGLFTSDSNGIFGGPFAHLDPVEDPPAWKVALTRYHHWAANVILALVALHVAVNLTYQFLKRDNLIGSMVTGEKPRGVYADQAEATGGSLLRALVCLTAAAVVVFGGIYAAGGSF